MRAGCLMAITEKQTLAKSLLILRLAFFCSLSILISTGSPALAQQTACTSPLREASPKQRATSDDAPVTVPFDLYGNNILVRARINDSQPLWWVFDSGASLNVLNERIAKKLGLQSKSSGEREEPPLQQSVIRKVYAGHDVPRMEGDLLYLREKVVGVVI